MREIDFSDGFTSVGAPTTTTPKMTLTNNQAVAADVTGLTWDRTVYRSMLVIYSIHSKTDSSERIGGGVLLFVWKASTSEWIMFQLVGEIDEGTASGITLTVDTNGDDAQVQYTSDDQSGANKERIIRWQTWGFNV